MSAITLRLKREGEGVVSEGDAGFTDFFRSEYPSLVRTLYLVVYDREQAQDIAQDAFVQLFAGGGGSRTTTDPKRGYAGSASGWPSGPVRGNVRGLI